MQPSTRWNMQPSFRWNMQPSIRWAMLVRLLLTPCLYLTRHSIWQSVLMLTLLDIIDCNPLVLSFIPAREARQCSLDPAYEVLDKVVDWLQNAVAVVLLTQTQHFAPTLQTLLWMFMAYRAFGVALMARTGNNKFYIYFVEFVKEYLLLLWWFGAAVPWRVLLLALAGKIGYEYLMHSRHVMLDLYRKLF